MKKLFSWVKKQKPVAVISMAIALAVIVSIVLLMVFRKPEEKMTRGEWVMLFGNRFGYTQYKETTPYFSDVQKDDPLFPVAQALMDDVILSYVGALEPEKPVTFWEMVKMASRVYGEGYIANRLGQENVTPEEMLDYVRREVAHSEKHSDESTLTREEAIAWLDQLHTAWLAREYGNSFTSSIKTNVQDWQSVTEYTLSENTLALTSAVGIKPGQILLLGANDANPTGIARKVEAVTAQQGDTYTLTVSEPAVEDIFENFQLEFSQQMEAGTFEPAEGVTVVDSNGGDLLVDISPTAFDGSSVTLTPLGDFSAGRDGVFFDRSISVSSDELLARNPDYPGGTTFSGTDTIADGVFIDENGNKKSKFDAGFELECGLRLSNFKLSGALNWRGLILASDFSVNTSMEITPYFTLQGNASRSFRLGSIPCQLGYGFVARVDLYVVISVNGEVSVEPVIRCAGGVQKSSGSYIPRATGSVACDTEVSVSADLGVQIGPDVTLSYLDVANFVDAYVFVGVGASTSWDSNTPTVLSAEIYLPTLHVGVGQNENTLLSKLLDTFRDPKLDWAVVDNNGGTFRCPVVFTREFEIVKQSPMQWHFSEGVLTVSGHIPDYMGENVGEVMPPWFRETQEDPGTEEEPNPVNVEIKKVVIGEGVTYIGAGAFSALSGLEEVALPESLLTIGRDAFAACEMLKAVKLPSNLVTIETGAFSWCPALEQVEFNEKLVRIGAEAFWDCSALKEVKLPDSVQTIGMHAFSGCTALKKLTFGSGVTKMGREAFAGCTALQKVILPTRLERIPMKSFYGCSALEEVVLSPNTQELGMLAFGNCRALSKCDGRESVKWKEEGVFYNCVALGEFDYADQLVWEEKYQERTNIGEHGWDGIQ